jgi:hypothetical protein
LDLGIILKKRSRQDLASHCVPFIIFHTLKKANKMVCLRVFGILALLSGAASAKRSFTEQPGRFATAINVRGGGGVDIDPKTVAKIGMGVLGMQTTVTALAPKETMKAYNVDLSSIGEFLAVYGAGCELNILLLLYLQIFEGVPFLKAMGYHTIPFMLQVAHKILTGKTEATGMPLANAYFVLAMNLFVTYACLSEAPYAMKVVKVYGIFSLINAVVMVPAPEAGLKMWKFAEAPTTESRFFMRALGFQLLAHGVVTCSQAFDKASALESLGYGLLVWALAAAVPLFITKEFKTLGIPQGAVAFWLLSFLACAAGILMK